uniref:Ig-like domain-containing protein n=1 Tax=Otolemur garnettii TaxID=30611 RepID=H0XX92_OTOGA
LFSSTEKLVVTTSTGHLVAVLGGQAMLSCQLLPPQSAEHMEVRWFRGEHSKPIHLYGGSHELNEETAPEYKNRTEIVKEGIGKGKVTLRIHNISISDDGSYQCLFSDNDFSDVASMNLSVAAHGLGTQIHVQHPHTEGLMVECNSRGWFPQPQMEWRDSKGEVVPHSSKSYSRDGAGLFHMKMTLLTSQSYNNITCCIYNTLTGEGKRTNIILAKPLLHQNHLGMNEFTYLVFALVFWSVLTFSVLGHMSRCCRISPCSRMLNSMTVQLLCFTICPIILIAVFLPFRIRGLNFKTQKFILLDTLVTIKSFLFFLFLFVCFL